MERERERERERVGRPWCNNYSDPKWTQGHKFKFWTILFTYDKALFTLEEGLL